MSGSCKNSHARNVTPVWTIEFYRYEIWMKDCKRWRIYYHSKYIVSVLITLNSLFSALFSHLQPPNNAFHYFLMLNSYVQSLWQQSLPPPSLDGEQWIFSTLISARFLIMSLTTSSWINSGIVDEWTVRRTENWLNSRSQRVAQGLVGGLSLVVSPKVQYWAQHC